jgi:hypothetical protein
VFLPHVILSFWVFFVHSFYLFLLEAKVSSHPVFTVPTFKLRVPSQIVSHILLRQSRNPVCAAFHLLTHDKNMGQRHISQTSGPWPRGESDGRVCLCFAVVSSPSNQDKGEGHTSPHRQHASFLHRRSTCLRFDCCQSLTA